MRMSQIHNSEMKVYFTTLYVCFTRTRCTPQGEIRMSQVQCLAKKLVILVISLIKWVFLAKDFEL